MEVTKWLKPLVHCCRVTPVANRSLPLTRPQGWGALAAMAAPTRVIELLLPLPLPIMSLRREREAMGGQVVRDLRRVVSRSSCGLVVAAGPQ